MRPCTSVNVTVCVREMRCVRAFVRYVEGACVCVFTTKVRVRSVAIVCRSCVVGCRLLCRVVWHAEKYVSRRRRVAKRLTRCTFKTSPRVPATCPWTCCPSTHGDSFKSHDGTEKAMFRIYNRAACEPHWTQCLAGYFSGICLSDADRPRGFAMLTARRIALVTSPPLRMIIGRQCS